MTIETDAAMLELSHQLPVEAARMLEKILKESFSQRNVAYDEGALSACICVLEISIPTLPMRYAEEMQATLLLLYRLREEVVTGLVGTPLP